MSDEKKKSFTPFGLKWQLCLGFIVIILAGAWTGSLSTDLAGGFAFMLALGIIFNEIGERIPFWNSYIGGGLVLTFIASAYLFTNKLIPAKYAKTVSLVMDDADFLSFFIVFLICGSILGLEKKLLLRSFAGYLPAIFGGLIGAAILGIAGGFIFGIDPQNILLNYVLPIMGGGNGAGAVPLSQIYETITGDKAANYYTFAITILTIANIFAILTAALLDQLGHKHPELTGDGNTLMRTSGKEVEAEKTDAIPTIKDIGGAFFMGVGFYAAGRLMGKAILPTVFGVAIHPFAWMIILVTIAAMLGIVPEKTKAAAKRLQSFMSSCLVLVIMVGVGADTNLNQLIAAINPSNVVIAFLIVVGAIIGSAIVGNLVGFYPIDSAITAGLCMANRGGSGDLAVLGASHRMGLIAYAQLSSRLGGGIVLIIGSVLFGAFLK
ncbi:MAG: 2-hydroxycarboxylate transporter family protein [Acidaminococcus sp.]|jgi:Na+/citrate or Na+/malate symporter|nr:2-hydroxycarboxylate transporter family protein [Acidaminococcus sp.]MCI2099680.1 2-hydroxycarboxylate transporter family protein [Acidaminococcus sp.]MCI2113915.1 2-hydroxycarboxylate transporter family protein [Acidaminococcus sp.]MCI2115848.1 2-hydroxycarboxylate transporter family protein [Acidaminococcus sp.]